MQRETLEVEFVTPCFLGGPANGGAEWRAASVRGQLRWWLRAIAGGDLATVRKVERELFGDTDRGSMVRVRTRPGRDFSSSRTPFDAPLLTPAELADRWEEAGAEPRLRIGSRTNALAYLAFGPITGNNLNRSYLRPQAHAFLDLTWVRKPSADLRRLFDQALWAWLHLGGIGSKSRKGYGSLQPVSMPPNLQPAKSRDELLAQIRRMLPQKDQTAPGPEWTRFSPGSRIFLGARGHRTWQEALSLLGAWLIAFRRRYGYAGETRTGLANRDYDWLDPASPRKLSNIPDRAGFGLPLPFRRRIPGTQNTESQIVTWSSGQGDARRASPLLLHVAHVGTQYVPVITYLPAQFLPAGANLRFKSRPGPFPANPLIDTVVTRFVDDLKAKNLVQEVF